MPCSECGGEGYIYWTETMHVTREMALDAQCPGMEGEPLEEKRDAECPSCHGTGKEPVDGEGVREGGAQ